MNDHQPCRLSLKVTALTDFLPAVTQCVETAALFYGLGKNESLKLRLAAEEIFSYLCDRVCRGAPLEIVCLGSLSHARVEFHFAVSAFDMGALNMTTSVSLDDDEDMTQMGLVIASRTVDRLYISKGIHNAVVLAMEQDKAYPAIADKTIEALDIRGNLSVAAPDAEEARRFAMQMTLCGDDPLRPDFFNYPGKVADLAASGICHALVAKANAGTIAGGMLYRPLTNKIMEVFSPCVFDPSREDEIAGMLMEACISKTARTKVVGLVNLTGLSASLRPQFETLGWLTDYREKGNPAVNPAFCRLLHEDPGCQVWTNPALRSYLEEEYTRLFLARDIRDVRNLGDARTGPSIFSTEMRRERSEAYLRPLWPGDDLAVNLERHIGLCKKESLKNIYFAVDLGIVWHASVTPVLLSHAFVPRIIIPFAGQADLVVFQHDES